MRISKSIIGICTLLLALTAPSFASGSAPAELGKWWKNSGVVRNLQLSESQVEQIERIFLRHRPVLAALLEELQTRESDLKTLMKANPVDEAKALYQTEIVAESRAALEKANSTMLLEIRRNLTNEQWEKLQVMHDLRESGLGFTSMDLEEEHRPGEKFYRVGDAGISAPKIIYNPKPQYTPQAKAAKIEGVLLLRGVIRRNGRVDSLKVLRGLGHGLDESAVEIISREWRFEPGTFNGQPVDVQANIEVSFRLF